MKKKIYIISLSALTLIIAAALFGFAYRSGAKKDAAPLLSEKMTAVTEENEKILQENEELEKKISDIETELSTKKTVNSYYMEYRKTHDSLTSEVAELKEKADSLERDIASKKSELENTPALSGESTGRRYALKKGETYSCPEDIPTGRYKASGSGTLTITTASGKTRRSPDLDVAYDNSYTLNLAEKERVKVTGDVTLTEIK